MNNGLMNRNYIWDKDQTIFKWRRRKKKEGRYGSSYKSRDNWTINEFAWKEVKNERNNNK